MPSGGVVRYTRPTLSRLLVVHVPVMAAVWLAAWRYMIHDYSATTVTIVIGVLAGLLIIVEQLATWYHSTHVVGSAQRQHQQSSAHRGGAACPARRPS